MTDYNSSNNDKIGGDPNGINIIHRDYYPSVTDNEEGKIGTNSGVIEKNTGFTEEITSLNGPKPDYNNGETESEITVIAPDIFYTSQEVPSSAEQRTLETISPSPKEVPLQQPEFKPKEEHLDQPVESIVQISDTAVVTATEKTTVPSDPLYRKAQNTEIEFIKSLMENSMENSNDSNKGVKTAHEQPTN